MNYKFWLFVDNLINNISYKLGNKWLLNRTQADMANSPKDILIYEQLKHTLNITPFERKINELGAYRDNWDPTPNDVFIPADDPLAEEYRLRWLKEHNIDASIATWTTEELILLHRYKIDTTLRKRMFQIVKLYHKHHFLMTIGVL